MRIGKTIKCLILPALIAGAGGEVHADFTANFSNGIPKNCLLENLDGATLPAGIYSTAYSGEGWYAGRLGRGAVAICPTYTGSDAAVQRRLVFQGVALSQGANYLRWMAKGVHPDFADAYKVMVKPSESTEWTTLFTTDREETDDWATRVAVLDPALGEKVDVAFECVSQNGFMLAIDEVTIGALTDRLYGCKTLTPYFVGYGNGITEIKVEVTNLGEAIPVSEFALFKGEEKVDGFGRLIQSLWMPGESDILTFDCPVSLEETVKYSVRALSAGDYVTLGEGELRCSNYPRKILVDKGTGTWCNNCPEGDIWLEELQRKYGKEAIAYLSTHTGDVMAQLGYFGNLEFYAIPSFLFNRVGSVCSSNTMVKQGMTAAAQKEVVMGLLADAYYTDGGKLYLQWDMEFAKDMDNAADRYRVAYTIHADIHKTEGAGFFQSNSATYSSYERYSMLPSTIRPELMWYHNVTMECQTAFTGIAGSIPADINAREAYLYSTEVSLPDNCASAPECVGVTLYVLDTESGEVLNADQFKEIRTSNGIDTTLANDNGIAIRKISADAIEASFPGEGDWYVDIYSLEGMKKAEYQGSGAQANIELPASKGILLINARQENLTKTFKIIRQ